MSAVPRIAAAIVTMNKRDAVLALLARLRDDGIPAFVTTNACTDGTPAAIRAAFPGVTVLESAENLGGTGGFNCAMLAALETQPSYVALVDDDALPEPGCLAKLADFLDSHDDYAFAAPAIHIASQPELLQETGGTVRFDREVAVEASNRFLPNEGLPAAIDVDYASACTLLVRAERIREVGVMDWSFFLFCDDVDWTLRLRGDRYKGACIPSVRSLHDFPWAKPLSLSRLYYFHRNGLLLLARWRPPSDRSLATLRRPLQRLIRDWLQAAAAGDHEMRDTCADALRDARAHRLGAWQGPRSLLREHMRIDAAWFRSKRIARVLVNVRNEQLLPNVVARLRALGGEGLALDAIGDPRHPPTLRAPERFGEILERDLRRRALARHILARRPRYDLVVTDAAIEPRNAFDALGAASALFHDGELHAVPHRRLAIVAVSFLAPTLAKALAWPFAWALARRPSMGAAPLAAHACLERSGLGLPRAQGLLSGQRNPR